jgi:ABC-type oligopeptide transport system substrate-binding subunit
MANPATAASVLATMRTLGTWAVTDPLTFVVTLPAPRGSFLDLLTASLGAIPSPAAVAQHGANYGSTPETTVGAGPFVLKQWVRNSQSVMERNPNYWQKDKGLPYLDSITFRGIGDPSQVTDALTTGTIDLGYISTAPDLAKRLKDQGMSFVRATTPDAAGATFNVSRPPFDDVRVRRAFVLATDAQDVINKALSGVAAPASGPGIAHFPEGHPMYDKSVTQKTNDLAEAQKLIDAYVAEKGQINTSALFPEVRATFGNALVQQWNRLKGVNVVADVQSSTQTIALLTQGNYAIRVATTVGGYEFVDQWGTQLKTGSPQNVIKYSNPALDKLVDEGIGASSVEDRKKYVNQLAKIITDDALTVRIYFSEFSTFFQDDIHVEDTFGTNSFPDPTTVWRS